MQLPLQLPAKLLPILQPRRFKILHGGRGGAKSHTIAQVLLMMGTLRSLRILCVRQIQDSLDASVKKLLADYIEKLNLGAYYEVLEREIRSKVNGTTFNFSGLQNHTKDSIKSWEGADIVWVEEARSVTSDAWNVLVPTIRKPGSEIWASFNPEDPDDYVYDRFVANTDPDAWVCEVNWRDNPWWTPELEAERRKLQLRNPDLYAHVYEGKLKTVAGIMLKRDWFRWYDKRALPRRLNIYGASDYAVTPDGGDFTEHGVGGLNADGELYLIDWWFGQKDPDEWIAAWVELVKQHKPRKWFEEAGVIRRSVNGAMNRAAKKAQAFTIRTSLPSASNKADRMLGFAARASAGTVYLPEGELWAIRLVNQLCAFTGEDGKVDDGADVCSLFARGLDEMADAPRDKPKPAGPKPGTFAWLTRNEAKPKPRTF